MANQIVFVAIVLLNVNALSVQAAAPVLTAYSEADPTYTVGTVIATNVATITGTETACAITPPLPGGLIFDEGTCAITGTPKTAVPAKIYTITASNLEGADDPPFSLTITVNAATCTLPADFTGFGVTDCDAITDAKTETACVMACASGYTGTATATCSVSGGKFALGGCTATCKLPAERTGFDTAGCDAISEAKTVTACKMACASGYTGPATNTCSTPGDFALGGCTANTCTLPASYLGFVVAACQATTGDPKTVADCSLQCDTGYSTAPTHTCPTSGQLFKFAGCEENTCSCVNGVGATGVACAVTGTATCATCNTGYHRVTGTVFTCEANEVCSVSKYNTHALCNASDLTKEVIYDAAKASVKCNLTLCTSTDCCKVYTMPTVTAVWSASAATATLLANMLQVPSAILAAAGSAMAGKLTGLAISSLTCVASGPSAAGTIALTMADATAALADSMFARYIAKGIASTMGCLESQVDVFLKPGTRRLTTDGTGRRLTGAVSGSFNVYNVNRGRNIGLGIGLGLVAPALGVGLGLGEGLLPGKATEAPVTVAPPTAAPVTTTAAPEEGSSMPLWAGILLALAVLACIGAAVFFGTQKKDKKKRAVKKAAPVVEEVRVIEEIVPMLAPVPMMQTYQPAPAFQSVQYVQQAPTVQYVQQAPVYTSTSRGF